jgi:RHS repeat-associated protein
VGLPNGTNVEYIIDGFNRRIGKRLGGLFVQGLLYAGQLRPIAELDETGAVVGEFVYGERGNVPELIVRGDSVYRILADHLGSPRLIVNVASGAVAQQMDFDEFGVVTRDDPPGFQPFGFAGGLYDNHTGLVRFGVRDYDASTGRWAAIDPIRFGGGDSNLYSYVANDPVGLIDSAGYSPVLGPAVLIGVTYGIVDAVMTDGTAFERFDTFGESAAAATVTAAAALSVSAINSNLASSTTGFLRLFASGKALHVAGALGILGALKGSNRMIRELLHGWTRGPLHGPRLDDCPTPAGDPPGPYGEPDTYSGTL